jgi:hypothetical protein
MRHACGLLFSNLIRGLVVPKFGEVESENSEFQFESYTFTKVRRQFDEALLSPNFVCQIGSSEDWFH